MISVADMLKNLTLHIQKMENMWGIGVRMEAGLSETRINYFTWNTVIGDSLPVLL